MLQLNQKQSFQDGQMILFPIIKKKMKKRERSSDNIKPL